jgi:hypothetical protein
MLAISQKLLDAQSTDEVAVATPAAFEQSGCNMAVHTIAWGASVSAGVVEIEAAPSHDYSGTWANLGTITYASGSPHAVTFTTQGPYKALRHRISTAVAGGTVTTYISGECA